ncbi:hypothetical protein GGI42DRAFT_296356 [Trichoderma sp. SZMC 28013]
MVAWTLVAPVLWAAMRTLAGAKRARICKPMHESPPAADCQYSRICWRCITGSTGEQSWGYIIARALPGPSCHSGPKPPPSCASFVCPPDSDSTHAFDLLYKSLETIRCSCIFLLHLDRFVLRPHPRYFLTALYPSRHFPPAFRSDKACCYIIPIPCFLRLSMYTPTVWAPASASLTNTKHTQQHHHR